MKESVLKSLTAGTDFISATRKYGHPFEFRPSHKLLMFGNHQPRLTGSDDTLWERVHVVPWNFTIPKAQRDPEFTGKLREEHDGIFAWLVHGLSEYWHVGLNPPKSVLAATSEYRHDSDPVQLFLDEKTQTGGSVGATKLFEAFDDYCRMNNIDHLDNATSFGRKLGSKGVQKTRKSYGYVYVDISLKNFKKPSVPAK